MHFSLKPFALGALLLVCTNLHAHEYDALLKAKKYADVDKATSAKLAIEPNNPDALQAKVDLILIEANEKRLDEGTKLAEQCINAHPKNSECHEALGNVLGTKAVMGGIMSAMGYVGKIKSAFKTAVELNPHNFSARLSLLQFYLQAPALVGGGTGKAKDLIVDTIKISPAAGALLQANFDLHDDNIERATQGALAVNTSSSDVLARQQRNLLANIGHTHANAKKFTESEKIFRELTTRFPDAMHGYFGLGKVYQEQGKAKEAIPYFEKAVVVDANASIFYRLGKAWNSLGEKAKAIPALEKALSFKPQLSKKAREEVEELLKTLKV